MSQHVHTQKGGPLVWHSHGAGGAGHRLPVEVAHPLGDPRRKTLRTHDGKPVGEKA